MPQTTVSTTRECSHPVCVGVTLTLVSALALEMVGQVPPEPWPQAPVRHSAGGGGGCQFEGATLLFHPHRAGL